MIKRINGIDDHVVTQSDLDEAMKGWQLISETEIEKIITHKFTDLVGYDKYKIVIDIESDGTANDYMLYFYILDSANARMALNGIVGTSQNTTSATTELTSNYIRTEYLGDYKKGYVEFEIDNCDIASLSRFKMFASGVEYDTDLFTTTAHGTTDIASNIGGFELNFYVADRIGTITLLGANI